jgi:protein tyrosine/serine phosphatase
MMRAIVLLLLLAMIASAENTGEGDIPRFSILADGLYRGGQPTERGFEFLKEKGIKTVINLRAEDNSEQASVEKLGLNYIRIPVDEVLPWSHVPPDAIAKFFELVDNRANYPIFFHCRRGADRTGFFSAIYRMALQNWDADRAYAEARQIGMRWYFAGLKSQIYAFHPPPPDELQPAIRKR